MFAKPEHTRREDGRSCAGCGTDLVAGAAFCMGCGKPTADTQEETVAVGAHINVSALSYQQLKDLAVERGVPSPHTMKKAELIRVLSGN